MNGIPAPKFAGPVRKWLQPRIRFASLAKSPALASRVLTCVIPAGILSGEGEGRKVPARFAFPLAEQLTAIYDLGDSPDSIVGDLGRDGVFDGEILPKEVAPFELYRLAVWAEVIRQDAQLQGKYSDRVSALANAIHRLSPLELSAEARQRVIIECVIEGLGYGGVRGYQFNIARNLWRETFVHGEIVRSRFAQSPGSPEQMEEKGFLARLMRGEIPPDQLRGYQARGLIKWEIHDNWAYLYITNRKECAFVDPARIMEDERRYGDCAANEVLFVVLGDPKKEVLSVYQVTNWPKNGAPLFYNFNEDLHLIRAFALALASAEENDELHRQVQELAVRDGLMGIYNRRFFDERIMEEIVRAHRLGTPLSLLMIDIDHFKAINDKHGHPVGDMVLKAVAQAVKSVVRNIDIVCRYGGEEIAVILPGINAESGGATAVAERIRQAIKGLELAAGGEGIKVTCSIGVCSADAEIMRREEVLPIITGADQALYSAKEGGRDRVVVSNLCG